MQERLQKIIARAGIASRRHAEQLIVSGQVRVNGRVVTELGTKADAGDDRIEAAGRVITAEERRVYILLNKPPEIVATMADPEGRKTLRNLLRGLPERVYPVGRLDYSASGLIFLTNDGDLADEMLKRWKNLSQVYHIKVKGRLTPEQLDQFGREAGARMRPVRQPDAARGHVANFWYEVALKDSKRDALRKVFPALQHFRGEIAIVGEKNQSRGGVIEAADGIDAFRQAAQKIAQRLAAFGVGHGGHDFRRLIQQDVHVALFRGDHPARGFDPIGRGVGFRAQLGDHVAVHAHLAADDQLLGVAPRRDARARDYFLQSFLHVSGTGISACPA